MRICRTLFNAGALFAAGILCFCSGFDDTTSLGAGVINSVDSNKINLPAHFREFSLDSAAVQNRFSTAVPGDSGFGYSLDTSGTLVLGAKNGLRAAGFVTFVCPPDTQKTRFFAKGDSLLSVGIRFSRDTAASRDICMIAAARATNDALNPGPTYLPLDSLRGTGLDTAAITTAVLRDSIFRACSDTIKDSTDMAAVFSFSIIDIGSTDSLVRLAANPQLIVTVKRDSSRISRTYPARSVQYAVKEINPDSLQKLAVPVSSYASRRTAVFAYDLRSLWSAVAPVPGSDVFLSAGFWVPNRSGDTIRVKWIIRSDTLCSDSVLDNAFSRVGTDTLLNSLRGFRNMRDTIQAYAGSTRPPKVYLYLRQQSARGWWKTISWSEAPLFTAVFFKR